MKTKPPLPWTRREFVGASAAAASLVTTIHCAPTAVFSSTESGTLAAAMDAIIPSTDGMPAASEVGCLAYLERVVPSIEGLAEQFHEVLAKLASRESPIEEALRRVEREEPELFSALRDFVYEAYYTNQEVWERIGYALYPTDHPGPDIQPFDPAVLDNVRKLGKLYVEVD